MGRDAVSVCLMRRPRIPHLKDAALDWWREKDSPSLCLSLVPGHDPGIEM